MRQHDNDMTPKLAFGEPDARHSKSQIWGCCAFYFNEESDKDIVIQMKNVKYDFDLT